MFRQPFGRSPLRGQVGNIPPALRRANLLMTTGQYVEAAEIFEQFAKGAQARNGPRAPWFFLQAGQARLLAGQVPAGIAHIQQGLGFFSQRGQFQRLYHAGMRFETELKVRNLATESQQIEDYLKATLPSGFVPAPGASLGKPKPVLPTACPGCGAPLRSDEVEWADELTAECPYCGSTVRVQG
jgi:hypothetical protein